MEIQLPQILFQIINFGVVVGVLTYLLYKPVLKVLDERSKRVEEGQKAAQKAIAEQEQLEETKKIVRQKAEKDAAKILEEATKVAAEKQRQVMAKAKEDATKEITRLKETWEEEKRQSLQDMKKGFADAVIAATERVIDVSLDTKSQAKLIDEEFSKLVKAM